MPFICRLLGGGLLGVAVACASGPVRFAALAHPPAQLTPEQEKGTVEEVKAFRKDVATAVTAKDSKKLRKFFADGYRHVADNGDVQRKDARLVDLLAGETGLENAPVADLEIRIPGGWTAIVTGKSPLKSKADGKTYEMRWMAVYVRVGDGWQIAASQAVRLGEAKP